jgi:hypothetical protein
VPASGNLLAYLRCHGSRRLLVALTLDDQPARLPLGALGGGEVLIGLRSHMAGDRVETELELEGDDGVVLALDPATSRDVTAR